jgi:KDO2-lipid IV(A) lauroyltransferase
LRIVLGSGATDEAVESAAEDIYASYSRYMVEFFTMGWPDLWGRHSRVKTVDASPLTAALANGGGVVLFGIHGGNWDLAASESSRRYGEFHSVGEDVRPVWLGMVMSRVRRHGGIALHGGDVGARELLRALRKGKVVGLVVERTVVGKGVEVELCGRTARIPTGPVSLAIRTGAPLIPTSIVRDGKGDLRIEFWPAVDLSDLDRGPSDVATGVQRMADQLTALIRRGYRSWYALQSIWLDESDEAESAPNAGS